MPICRSFLLLLALVAAPTFAAEARVGDADSKPVPDKFDPNYPDMKEWAEAGVRGGIPARDASKVVKTLKAGDDIQKAIDEAAKTGGVVLLSPGTYPITACLQLRSNVILRGQNKETVILENAMRSARLTVQYFTVRFAQAKHAGLEDLTMRHAEVAQIGLDKYAERVAGPINNPTGNGLLHVGGVVIEDSEDCWVDNVNILHSGSHPIDAAGLRITLRDVLIDGAFNKGETGAPSGEGNVYFSVTHGLMYRCTVSNVRHCLVMRDTLSGGDCKFNAIIDCDFTGDVDFHGNRRDSGHNLFEGVLVRSLLSHGWTAWAYWKKEEIGVGNIAYKSIGWGGNAKDTFASTNPEKVYTFTGMKDPNVLAEVDKPAPKAATLYAVSGARPTAIEKLGAWPKNPGQARDVMLKRMIQSPATRPSK
jgi:hypothetical protein